MMKPEEIEVNQEDNAKHNFSFEREFNEREAASWDSYADPSGDVGQAFTDSEDAIDDILVQVKDFLCENFTVAEVGKYANLTVMLSLSIERHE